MVMSLASNRLILSRNLLSSLAFLLLLVSFLNSRSSYIGDEKKKKRKVGYRFRPTNDELIDHYLKKKVQGIDCQSVIHEVDILDFEPEDLLAIYATSPEDSYCYLFYKLEENGRKRKRGGGGFNRTLNSGTGNWKSTGKPRDVYSEKTNQRIAIKKTLVFERHKKHKAKENVNKGKNSSQWTMHEYHLRSYLDYPENYVIVKLKKKGPMGVAPAPEKRSSSNLLEEGKEVSTPTTVNEVEINDQSAIRSNSCVSDSMLVSESNPSSCVDNTQSLANLEHNFNSYDQQNNVNIEQATPYEARSMGANTEQGVSDMGASVAFSNMLNFPWEQLLDNIDNDERIPSYPANGLSSCAMATSSRESSDVIDIDNYIDLQYESMQIEQVGNVPGDAEASIVSHEALQSAHHPEQSSYSQGFQNGSGVNSSLQTPESVPVDTEEKSWYGISIEDLDLICDRDNHYHSIYETMLSQVFYEQNFQPNQGCDNTLESPQLNHKI